MNFHQSMGLELQYLQIIFQNNLEIQKSFSTFAL
jgi:hypothetical protein